MTMRKIYVESGIGVAVVHNRIVVIIYMLNILMIEGRIVAIHIDIEACIIDKVFLRSHSFSFDLLFAYMKKRKNEFNFIIFIKLINYINYIKVDA